MVWWALWVLGSWEVDMNRSFRLVLLIGLALTLGACSKKTSVAPLGPSPQPSPSPSVASYLFYTPPLANNHCAIDLYATQKDQAGNLFFSPFSISSALALAGEGAQGATAQEIWTALKLNPDAAARQAAYAAVMAEVNRAGKPYTLVTANDVWLENSMGCLGAYRNVVTGPYQASVSLLNFIGDPAGSLGAINSRVADETNNVIQNLLPGGFVTTDTRLVLTNAIYFKAAWKTLFETYDTSDDPFYPTPGAPVTVPTMHVTMSANQGDYHGLAQVLEMPYVDEDVSMYVFLPPAGGMPALENDLTGSAFSEWIAAWRAGGTSSWDAAISFPKFTFETSMDLKPALQSLGVQTAFTASADFKGIADTDFRLDGAVHKAFVQVNEEGTEAAAATGVGGGIATSVSAGPTPFTVDHPFLFVIYENRADTVLFIGRVNQPVGG